MRANSIAWALFASLWMCGVGIAVTKDNQAAVAFALAAVGAALMSGLYRIAAALEERQCPTYSTRSGYGPRRD